LLRNIPSHKGILIIFFLHVNEVVPEPHFLLALLVPVRIQLPLKQLVLMALFKFIEIKLVFRLVKPLLKNSKKFIDEHPPENLVQICSILRWLLGLTLSRRVLSALWSILSPSLLDDLLVKEIPLANEVLSQEILI